jgi:hypothetical protein
MATPEITIRTTHRLNKSELVAQLLYWRRYWDPAAYVESDPPVGVTREMVRASIEEYGSGETVSCWPDYIAPRWCTQVQEWAERQIVRAWPELKELER